MMFSERGILETIRASVRSISSERGVCPVDNRRKRPGLTLVNHAWQQLFSMKKGVQAGLSFFGGSICGLLAFVLAVAIYECDFYLRVPANTTPHAAVYRGRGGRSVVVWCKVPGYCEQLRVDRDAKELFVNNNEMLDLGILFLWPEVAGQGQPVADTEKCGGGLVEFCSGHCDYYDAFEDANN